MFCINERNIYAGEYLQAVNNISNDTKEIQQSQREALSRYEKEGETRNKQ